MKGKRRKLARVTSSAGSNFRCLGLILTRFFPTKTSVTFKTGVNKTKFPETYRFPENPRIVEFLKSSNKRTKFPEILRGELSGLEIPKNFQFFE